MSTKKLVVVAGATGQQGGSVVKALLSHGGYAIRGLTRDTASASSQSLIAKGVEMVKASLLDKDSLIVAFKGAYAVYGVTIPNTPDSETDMGKNMVDACLANHVSLFFWSSLPSAAEFTNGEVTGIRLATLHTVSTLKLIERYSLMEEKAVVDKYIKAVGQPTVTFWTGWFTEKWVLLQVRGES
ncbi:NAD(P)-binding protein [Calocera cornea HHB12733]|uniref:NAD(P)-binding protein n=1 Tax=Calocera cornea HHB12733 TaxID=1353952 RepID=A0A165HZ45_9BASI|nr:NAD(P)-binding protein [Calocera cornea HHB12733]